MGYIDLENISFSYDEVKVFEQYSLSIERGEAVIFMGENGSGKTTLFGILNGLIFPQSGTYFFDGEKIDKKYLDVNKNSKLFHKRIGYLFQNPDVMLFNGNVFDEIAFGPRQMGLDDDEVRKRVADVVQMFGIEDLKDRAPYHLSGGQKKKVALASVLSLNPDVLVLDEPMAGLDKKSGEALADLLLELKRAGKTLAVATHSSELAKKLEARVENLKKL